MKNSIFFPTRRNVLAGLGAVTGATALSSCYSAGTNSKHYDTIIIGAGLSGLNAARILESEGASLLILESSNRMGGRLMTLDDVINKPEAGGLQVGPMYARLRSTAMELGIELEEFAPTPPGMMIHFNGHNINFQDWATWEHNPLPESMKKIPPFAIVGSMLPRQNPLSDLDSWLEQDARQYDVPLRNYIGKLGDDDNIRKMIDVSLQGKDIDEISVLGELRKSRIRIFESGNGKSHKIKGGSSRLPEAMANSLKSEIKHGKKVTHITQKGAKTLVQCNDGSQYSANHIICTLPFAVLKDVIFDPGLPSLQNEAVNTIHYLPVTSFFFTVDEPFWQQDQYPPAMWTTSILERIFPLASPDNTQLIFWGLINGNNALEFDKRSRSEQEQLILNELGRIRPTMAGKISLKKIHSWTKYSHNKGAWSYWKAGQISKFGNIYSQAHANIHFAGEHTAVFASGMEAAFESGERAAWEILDK